MVVHSILVALGWLCLALSGAYFAAVAWLALRAATTLDQLATVGLPQLSHWPRLSLVTPARDEESTLEAAVRSRLASDYPDLELIVVDDRSKDGTLEVIERLAREDSRVRLVQVTALPAGWLGKVHALARGAEAATGEWLLFTDADVHFAPEALRRAVGYCEARQLDFLAAIPDLWPSGLWVDTAISSIVRSLTLGLRRRAIEDPRSRASSGSGVFNLVRRSALERTEGFEALRLEVMDDAGLGQLVKWSGARCSVVNACGLVGLHYYRTVGEIFRGGEKNAFSLIGRFRLSILLSAIAVMFAVEWSWLWAFLAGGRFAVAGAALLALDWLGALILASCCRRPWLPALLTPIGATLMFAVGLTLGLPRHPPRRHLLARDVLLAGRSACGDEVRAVLVPAERRCCRLA